MTASRYHPLRAALAALAIWLVGATDSAAEDTASLTARLDALAQAFMATDAVPGAIATIVAGDEVILRGYGLSDIAAGVPADPKDVRFEIGSISKLFTWIAVMMLVEDGRLALHADVATYLPGFEVPGRTPLTLAQVMSHRSGYEESYRIFDEGIAALPRAEALAAAAPAQVFPRGEVTSYSNWAAALAGLVVEEVAGEPWEAFVQARIVDPLGMADTTLAERLRRPGQPPLAQSYRVQGGIPHPAYRIDIGAFGPAGAIASTAADMASFLRFLMGNGSLDGVRLLQPETMARLRTRLFDDRPGAADMAHGFQAQPRFSTTVYGHGGGLNEFLSNLVFIPEIRAGVFISQNGGNGSALPFLAPNMILETLAVEAGLGETSAQPVPNAAAQAAEAAGRYLTNRRTFSGAGQILAALSPLTVTALPDGAILLPRPVSHGPVRHDPIGPDIWQDSQGARVMILRDAEGRVLRLADGSGAQTHERLRGLADPVWLWVSFGLASLLSVTTLLGLLWRRGLGAGSRVGTLAAALSLVGAVSVLALATAGGATALVAGRLGSEFLFDQPQPTFEIFLGMGNVVAFMAALVVLAQIGVWRAPGWSFSRRLHHGAFAFALASFAGLMLRWGLAFGGSI